MQRTAQRFNAVAGFPISSDGECVNHLNHHILVEYAGNEVSNGGRSFFATMEGKV